MLQQITPSDQQFRPCPVPSEMWNARVKMSHFNFYLRDIRENWRTNGSTVQF